MSKQIVKPGQKTPISGQYKIPGTNVEITLVKGKTVPPNTVSNKQYYILSDITKHKK